MGRALKILLVILLFIGFFELGLFSSYTIVTSNVPNIEELAEFQINTIKGLINSENVNNALIKDPTEVSIINNKEVATALGEKSQVDGISVDDMNVTTYDELNNQINVTIETLGFSAPNSTSGQIIISQNPSYKVIAHGTAKYRDGGYNIDPNSLVVESILKLY